MATITTSYIGVTGTNFYNILVPTYMTSGQYVTVSGAGLLFKSIPSWFSARGGNLVGQNRQEIGMVVIPEFSGNIDCGWGGSYNLDPTHNMILKPLSGLVRWSINKNGTDSTGFLMDTFPYSEIYNLDVHNGRAIKTSYGHTGIWIMGSPYAKLINPKVYDMMAADGTGTLTGGIHIGYATFFPNDCAHMDVVNPIVHSVSGSPFAQGLYFTGANNSRLYNATVFGLGIHVHGTTSFDGSGCIAISAGSGYTVKNCLATRAVGLPGFYSSASGVNYYSNNSANDTSALGTSPKVVSSTLEYTNPNIFDFHLKDTATSYGTGTDTPYPFDFENKHRVSGHFDRSAYASSYTLYSGIIDGLLFSSGTISNTSIQSSGLLTDVYLTNMPTMYLRQENVLEGTYNKGLFSITVNSKVTDKWNFYLEAVNNVVNSIPTYISYMASGNAVDVYGFYKETLELHAGLSDIYSFDNPAYIWASTVNGKYTTGRLPVYFKKIG